MNEAEMMLGLAKITLEDALESGDINRLLRDATCVVDGIASYFKDNPPPKRKIEVVA